MGKGFEFRDKFLMIDFVLLYWALGDSR